MKPRVPLSLALLLTALCAAAQKPPVRPPKTDDTAALEEAVRAVDRAKEKSEATKKSEGAPVDPGTKPAKPAAPTPAAKEPSAAKPAKGKSDAPATQTQITGLEDAELDNARNIIIFRKNVVVDRPDLKIWCDQLEIALNRGQTKPTTRPAPEKKDEEADAFSAETIKSATATASGGGLVVIWRKTETGDVVAVGRKAVYTAADGAFTITGLPEVLRDMSLHFHSPGEADKLIMFKNGSARGSKKQDLNLSTVRAKEIRQRLFSHVPGRRPAEASAPGEAEPAPSSSGTDTPPPAPLPAPPPPKSSPGN